MIQEAQKRIGDFLNGIKRKWKQLLNLFFAADELWEIWNFFDSIDCFSAKCHQLMALRRHKL